MAEQDSEADQRLRVIYEAIWVFAKVQRVPTKRDDRGQPDDRSSRDIKTVLADEQLRPVALEILSEAHDYFLAIDASPKAARLAKLIDELQQ